ncbi:MAG: DUF1338 domain-containing protein [Alphaproteobacteria bacterium]|nr:DUF1338 domain-containing protein [Alphaproteobacteria bacterium]
MQREEVFESLWQDFTRIAPAAATIRAALVDAGEVVINDHVAFRTFDRGPLRLDALEPHLLGLGYTRLAPYAFEGKKLRAWGYVHADPLAPKVFLSELEVDRCSPGLQALVDELVAQVPADAADDVAVLWSGRPWAPVDHATWAQAAEESEYAAWLAALGYHANHFTVSVNHLSPALHGIEAVLAFVERLGFAINESGGRVKGTPEVLLEQGSTLADRVPVELADGERLLPTCYYEFALRHPQADGTLYPGFVAASADRIFESTHAG